MAKSPKRSQEDDTGTMPIEEMSEFIILANKMKVKLDDKRPFRKVECLNNVGVEPFKFKPHIILGTCLFDRLSSKEKLAVIAHELSHLKMRHVFVGAGSIVVSTMMILLSVPRGSWIASIMVLTALFMGFWVASYLCEYWADCVALRYTKDKDSFISAIRKLEPPERWNIDYETHPSINRRVAKLSRK